MSAPAAAADGAGDAVEMTPIGDAKAKVGKSGTGYQRMNETKEGGQYSVMEAKRKRFDINSYTIQKGAKGWKNLKKRLDGVEDATRERERNEDGKVPTAVAEQDRKGDDSTKFGTWDGVLVSCLLNIFGVIMFLRLPWTVGQAGIGLAIVIILISNVVTTITTLSMSAICTNGEVRAGGAYYLISRSLGHRIGAPIGILFSIGQAVAIALYVVGFCETLVLQLFDTFSLTGDELNDIRVFGLVITTVLLIMALIGTGWVIKLQVGLLGLLVTSILCALFGTFSPPDRSKLIVGWNSDAISDNMGPEFREGYDFFSVFAVFFPAVTGIMAGANISGDLKNPSENIPEGTLWAIIISTIVYIIMAIFVGATCARGPEGSDEGLYNNVLIMVDLAVPYIGGPFVLAGIYAATFSSGLASLVGAPRILLAVAQDDLIPVLSRFAEVRERDNAPIKGYYIVFVVACGCVCIGTLNAIAPLISMFFMITYGLINLSCFVQDISKSPAWRPQFKYFNKWVSFFGFLLCIVIMFLTSWYIALIAIFIAAGIYFYIDYRDPQINWGSANQARQFYDVEKAMMKMRSFQTHVKTYRPHYLVMTGEPTNRIELARFVASLRKGYGITVYGNVFRGTFYEKMSYDEQNVEKVKVYRDRKFDAGYFVENKATMPADLKVRGFYQTVLAKTLRKGTQAMLCVSGLGVMRPNVLVLGFKNNWKDVLVAEEKAKADERRAAEAKRPAMERKDDDSTDADAENSIEDYVGMIRDGFKMGLGVMVCRNMKQIRWDSEASLQKTVDVWWLVDDGGLTCLVPYILSMHSWWKKHTDGGVNSCRVRLNLITGDDDQSAVTAVHDMLQKFRIPWSADDINGFNLGKEAVSNIVENYKSYGRGSVNKESKKKNDHWMRVADTIRTESKNARIVFVTIPYPLEGIENSLYMSWLDNLSSGKDYNVPTVMIRGNDENVHTFYLE